MLLENYRVAKTFWKIAKGIREKDIRKSILFFQAGKRIITCPRPFQEEDKSLLRLENGILNRAYQFLNGTIPEKYRKYIVDKNGYPMWCDNDKISPLLQQAIEEGVPELTGLVYPFASRIKEELLHAEEIERVKINGINKEITGKIVFLCQVKRRPCIQEIKGMVVEKKCNTRWIGRIRGIEIPCEIVFLSPEEWGETEDSFSLQGDLHVHSTWSDGFNSLEEIKLHARKLGLKYVAITDHLGRKKDEDDTALEEKKKRLLERNRVIEKLNKEGEVKLLKGVEVDIDLDGHLVCEDEAFFKEFDIIVAGIHFKVSENRIGRIVKAMEYPFVHGIAHPVNRDLFFNHVGITFNEVEKIFKAAVQRNKWVEINCDFNRFEPPLEYIRMGKRMGVKFYLGTDSHSLWMMGLVFPALAWLRSVLSPTDLVNNSI